MNQVYFGDFSSKEDVISSFCPPNNELDDAEILFASYDCDGYEGSAFVLLRKDGKLYELNGSHCSCNGLSDCWGLEETSAEALKQREWWGHTKTMTRVVNQLLVDLAK